MKKLTFVLSAMLLMLVLSNNIHAQGKFGRIGKTFSKSKAFELYGPVKNSAKIESKKLSQILNKAGDYVLFSLKRGQLKVYDSKRVELYPVEGNTIDEREPLRVFSSDQVQELISSSTDSEIVIENRINVLTLTTGENTLEMGLHCPPMCTQ